MQKWCPVRFQEFMLAFHLLLSVYWSSDRETGCIAVAPRLVWKTLTHTLSGSLAPLISPGRPLPFGCRGLHCRCASWSCLPPVGYFLHFISCGSLQWSHLLQRHFFIDFFELYIFLCTPPCLFVEGQELHFLGWAGRASHMVQAIPVGIIRG